MEYHRARLQYQFNKLQPIRDGVFSAYGGNIEFELFSFFEICYHLKDWVKHSFECASFSNVEDYISQTPALIICGDICNKLKHKRLDRKLRSGSEPRVFMITSTMTIGPIGSTSIMSIDGARIETERGDECCFELAKECMKAWQTYFIMNNAAYINCSTSI